MPVHSPASRRAAIAALVAGIFVGCGEVPPPLAQGVAPPIRATGRGGGLSAGPSSGDGGAPLPLAGAASAGCLSCNPVQPPNGGCPLSESCVREMQGSQALYLCADASGATGCPAFLAPLTQAVLPPGCLLCVPTGAGNGGCPTNESCQSMMLGADSASFCTDAYGKTGCPFCSPSDGLNGGCTDQEACVPFLVAGAPLYLCQGPGGTGM